MNPVCVLNEMCVEEQFALLYVRGYIRQRTPRTIVSQWGKLFKHEVQQCIIWKSNIYK